MTLILLIKMVVPALVISRIMAEYVLYETLCHLNGTWKGFIRFEKHQLIRMIQRRTVDWSKINITHVHRSHKRLRQTSH